jgi:hypothetical protein
MENEDINLPNTDEEFDPMNEDEATRPDWGEKLMEWKVKEFVKHDRNGGWYVVTGIIVALILVYSFVVGNFLFALMTILTVFIIFIYEVKEPRSLSVVIWEDGVQFGSKFYDYDNLDGFYLIYKPDVVKKVYLEFHSGWRQDLGISIDDQNPVEIRDILLEYLPENLDKEDESLSDTMGRVFKI